MIKDLFDAGVTLISVLVFIQAAHTLYLQLYTWNRPSSGTGAPDEFIPPRLSFTVMLPARHEEDVIAGHDRARGAGGLPGGSDSDSGDLLSRRRGHH